MACVLHHGPGNMLSMELAVELLLRHFFRQGSNIKLK